MEYKIAVLPGDGIGPEVMDEAIKVLDAAQKKYDFSLVYEFAQVGGAAIDACGEALPEKTMEVYKWMFYKKHYSQGGPSVGTKDMGDKIVERLN